VHFITESTIAQLMLEKGDLDYLGVRPEMISKKVHEAPWGKTVFLEENRSLAVATTQNSLFLNLRLPIFQDRDTRRALQMLLNREAINKTMLEGKSLPATGPWHRLNDSADPNIQPIAYQPKEAARLLSKAGWKDTDQDGVLDKMIDRKKTPFHFTVIIPRAIWEKYLVYYQTDLKKAGIQMEIKLLDWSLFTKNMDDLNYESYIVGRGYPGQIDFDPEGEWHSRHRAKLDGNNIGYSNPEVDHLLEQIQVENDRPKRLELLRKAYRLISEDQSQILWFSDPAQYYGRSSRLVIPKPCYKYRLGWEYWSLN